MLSIPLNSSPLTSPSVSRMFFTLPPHPPGEPYLLCHLRDLWLQAVGQQHQGRIPGPDEETTQGIRGRCLECGKEGKRKREMWAGRGERRRRRRGGQAGPSVHPCSRDHGVGEFEGGWAAGGCWETQDAHGVRSMAWSSMGPRESDMPDMGALERRNRSERVFC